MPHFSVIIPTLHSKTLARTLAALQQQTVGASNIEVIVVGMDLDLKSGEWGEFYPTEQPLPPGAARNRGASNAGGEIFAFIDSDCIPAPDWLAVLAERFTDPQITVVGGGVTFSAENYWALADNISMFHDYLSSLPPGEREQLPSLNLAIRRQVFLEGGGFDNHRRTGEDSDLTIRLKEHGHALYFEPCAIVQHAPHRNRAVDFFRHHFLHGLHSVKFDPRYTKRGVERFLGNPWALLAVSPVLAVGITAKIFFENKYLWHYWYTAPAIGAAKLIWCFGAVLRLARSTVAPDKMRDL
ncbi:MAG: hypothetical protein OHK0031_07390 [Anaerolineales bacterium]